MGASGKWVKALKGLKETENEDNKMVGGKKKSKQWRGSSRDLSSYWKGFKRNHRAASKGYDSLRHGGAFSAAMATVVGALPKDFRVMTQEWAAIRIQIAFRGFLELMQLQLVVKLYYRLMLTLTLVIALFLIIFWA